MTVAFWLQLTAVVLLLALAAVAVALAVEFDERITYVADVLPSDPDEVRAERTVNVGTAAIVAGLLVAAAICLAATAWPIRRGSSRARTLVFVVAGMHLLIGVESCASGMASGALVLALSGSESPQAHFWTDSPFDEALYLESTTAHDILLASQIAGTIIATLAVFVVVVLVTVPAAQRHFDRRTISG
ncbi:hypothetical protein [Asanoa hainanensis]|uniref:hypothetical protein n=1 Tax=Asanoa hainanensis TaxID=560556 RepID=UPI000B76BBA3|nr:hypothetical protein [Asanoa hainanensis]